jgi:uncharacterized protein (DUF1499 family)
MSRQMKSRHLDQKLLKPIQFVRVEASSSGFQGILDKFGVTIGKESFIVKPRSPMFPELPENEFLCNQIADLLGIRVAEYGYWKMGKDFVFVTKNFMTVSGSKGSLLHFNRKIKGKWSCEAVVKSIRKESTVVDHDLKQFVLTCLFDSLIGNSDRHSRNLAYIYQTGKYKLAPIYDSVSVMIAKKLDYQMIKDMNWGGKVRTKLSVAPSFHDYVTEFQKLRLAELVDSVLVKIKKNQQRVIQLIENSRLGATNRFLLKERLEEIFGSLK